MSLPKISVLFLILIGLVFSTSACSQRRTAQSTPSNIEKHLKILRGTNSTILLPDGKVFIQGGHLQPVGENHELLYGKEFPFEVFDPSTKESVVSQQRQDHYFLHYAVTLLQDGKIFISGGQQVDFKENTYTRDIWKITKVSSIHAFDPIALTFKPLGKLHHSRAFHTSSQLDADRILIIGGTNFKYPGESEPEVDQTTEIFDIKLGRSKLSNPLHFPRQGHYTVPMADGTVLVAGGFEKYASRHWHAEYYNPHTNTFDPVDLGENSLGIIPSKLPDGQLILPNIGYVTPSPYCLFDCNRRGPGYLSVHIYNPKTNQLKRLSGRDGLDWDVTVKPIILPNGNIIFSAFDRKQKCQMSEKLDLYNPFTNQVKTVAWLNHKRFGHYLTLLKDGRILVTGGYIAGKISKEDLSSYTGDNQCEGKATDTYEIIDWQLAQRLNSLKK